MKGKTEMIDKGLTKEEFKKTILFIDISTFFLICLLSVSSYFVLIK